MPTVKHLSDSQVKTLPEFRVGSTVRVHNRIKEGSKERVQVFEGLVIARKGGSGVNATFTVRKVSYGVGVERVFPVHSPNVVKLEVTKSPSVRRAKLYYVRKRQDSLPRTREKKTQKQK